ncbi:MAG: ArsB/NhaD family transporter [Anaerolineaceae bacterium]
MTAIIISAIIVLVCLGLFMWEKITPTVIATLGALVMVTVGRMMGFYTEKQALANIDLFTILLLLGMMILVELLEPTGFFQYLALMAGRLSRGKPIRLLFLLGLISAVVSMFLPNITTIVLIAPVTILICEILGVESRPFLIAEAVFSNTGGVATLIGDPPNMLVASASGFVFNDFLTHSLPIVIIVLVAVVFLLRYLFRRELEVKVDSNTLLSLKPSEAIKDKQTIYKVLIVLAAAMLCMAFQSQLGVSPAYIALASSGIAFLWVGSNLKQTLKRVEWDVLLFFGSLFVMIGGLEASGALHTLATVFYGMKDLPPTVIGLILLWIVAFSSAIIDNVPITIAMIPIILELQSIGVDIQPLWWALVFGAGFGGNGTIIGASTNILIASLSEKTSTPITPRYWNKRGLPVMLVSCASASLFYILVGLIIGW